jgi:hypothetical protein
LEGGVYVDVTTILEPVLLVLTIVLTGLKIRDHRRKRGGE